MCVERLPKGGTPSGHGGGGDSEQEKEQTEDDNPQPSSHARLPAGGPGGRGLTFDWLPQVYTPRSRGNQRDMFRKWGSVLIADFGPKGSYEGTGRLRNERRNGTAFTAEDAENAENGRGLGNGERQRGKRNAERFQCGVRNAECGLNPSSFACANFAVAGGGRQRHCLHGETPRLASLARGDSPHGGRTTHWRTSRQPATAPWQGEPAVARPRAVAVPGWHPARRREGFD